MRPLPFEESERLDSAEELVVVMPVYNDWASMILVLEQLDTALATAGEIAQVLVVDDGSTEPISCAPPSVFRNLRTVDVVRLKRNVGHQRAIAVGLAMVADQLDPRMVVVMDADGEDNPAELPNLVARCRAENAQKIVFAHRTKRSEPLAFRVFYRVYKAIFMVLIGRAIHFGNFSVVPRDRLSSLVATSELWNHYAAAVLKSRQPFVTEPSRRGKRLAGRTRMSFVSLVIHGLSAVSVFSEILGVRLLIATLALMGVTAAGIVSTIGIRFFTDWAIPGWASTVVGNLAILFLQAAMLVTVFVFVVLSGRASIELAPAEYYDRLVHSINRFYSREDCRGTFGSEGGGL